MGQGGKVPKLACNLGRLTLQNDGRRDSVMVSYSLGAGFFGISIKFHKEKSLKICPKSQGKKSTKPGAKRSEKIW